MWKCLESPIRKFHTLITKDDTLSLVIFIWNGKVNNRRCYIITQHFCEEFVFLDELGWGPLLLVGV